MPKKLLISGAGIAGAILAFWLSRSGWNVSIVERAAETRSSGSPVDVSFERSMGRRFDLVVGADGVHSATRRLAFGPETAYA